MHKSENEIISAVSLMNLTKEEKLEPKELPSLALAYLGDAVYELYVRTHLLASGLRNVGELHSSAVALVSAAGQSGLLRSLEPLLTEEELDVYKRGRNTKSPHSRQNTGIVDYRRATGLEALIGYLFLAQREDRLSLIFGLLFSQPPVVDPSVLP